MTKLYGVMAGVPMQTLQSGAALASAPPICGGSADQVLWRDMAITAGNVIGDVVSLGVFRPTAFIDAANSVIAYDVLGAGCTISIGDVNYPTGLRSPFAVSTAGATLSMNTPAGGLVIAPLWQRLGYPANPGVPIELLATFGGAAPVNGAHIGWVWYGRNI
jgi:hypothetical protein